MENGYGFALFRKDPGSSNSKPGQAPKLAAFEAGFDHAALVVLAALVAALVAQADLHSRDVIADSAQGALNHATELSGQRLVTFDVVVGIDLYLHGVLLL
jgi:hypothetical protein